VDPAALPDSLGRLGFAEYHAPPSDTLGPSVVPLTAPAYLTGHDAELRARIVDREPPDSAALYIRPATGGSYQRFAMRPAGGYVHAAVVPGAALQPGPQELAITIFRGDSALTFPGGLRRKPTDWNYVNRESWTVDVVQDRTPVRLFDPETDAGRLSFTRIGDAGRRGLFRVGLSGATGAQVFHLALPVDTAGWSPPDYAASLVIAERIQAQGETIAAADAVRLRLRGLGPHQVLHVTLMEQDGTSWSAAVPVDSTWSERSLPLASFAIARGVKLPQGFPGEWNYWVGPAEGRGGAGDRPRMSRLERLQLSLRPEGTGPVRPEGYGVEVEWVILGLDGGPATR
jgi:hypothetical protein